MRRAPDADAAPPVFVRRAEEVVVRETGGVEAGVEPPDASGDLDRAISSPLELATRGEEVRPITGGVAVREGGGVGRLMEGLSQEEKKSSSASLGAVASSPPSTITSLGYLVGVSFGYP